MHLLKVAYNEYISEHYDAYDARKDEARTEAIAQKVHRLGLSYNQFVEVACSLWHNWSEQKGWDYPLWNVITCDKTFERIEDLLQYTDVGAEDELGEFEYELSYLLDYIAWWIGEGGKPKHELDTSIETKIEVSEYVCQMYGVPFVSSDYNYIAQQIERLHGDNC